MLANSLNSALYNEWLGHVQVPEVKDAFAFLVCSAATMSTLSCHAQFKGVVRDFRFMNEANEQPFSFIVNKNWLLFYFRAPSVRSGKYQFEDLSNQFPESNENNRGEWIVRLRTVADTRRLVKFLKLQ
jgi:hypothetical protein